MSALRWTRTDLSDGASEILTLVRPTSGRAFGCAELERVYPYLVEVCSGPNVGDDFVGLYDLDGDQINASEVAEWEPVSRAAAAPEVLDHVESAWESGSNVVAQFGEVQP